MIIYKVGGAVRDQILGRPVHEIDYVVVGSTPEAMIKLGYQPVGKHFPVFLHPKTHEEYALARTERKTGPGHQAFTFHADESVTLIEDLKRRDLTINAIALSDDGELIDPYNGKADLDKHILRHVSEAFSEDPLRVLRVARFMAQLGDFNFSIAPETLALMKQLAASDELNSLSAERIWRETEKALKAPHPTHYFETLEDCGALSLFWTNLDIAALKNVQSDDPVIRYASAAHHATAQFIVPKEYAELARMAQLIANENLESASPEVLWQLIKSLDAVRRPERFEQAIEAAMALSAQLDNGLKKLQRATSALATQDLTAIKTSSLPGLEKAEAIKASQLKCLAALE